MRVTFDTNALDLACRPERFPKDPRQPHLHEVRDALKDGKLKGFFPVTMLTLEGIQKTDRATVFSGTKLRKVDEKTGVAKNADLPEEIRRRVGGRDIPKIDVGLQVEQPDRKPLHPEVLARVAAARALGLRILRAPPRVAMFDLTDPDGSYYEPIDKANLPLWQSRVSQVLRAIEARGVGGAQVKALGIALGVTSPEKVWFAALDQAKDVHEKRAVERAFSEWADGDALATHIAYGIEVFCSADVGNSNSTHSVLDAPNRSWLTQTYGVQFMTFDDLLASLAM